MKAEDLEALRESLSDDRRATRIHSGPSPRPDEEQLGVEPTGAGHTDRFRSESLVKAQASDFSLPISDPHLLYPMQIRLETRGDPIKIAYLFLWVSFPTDENMIRWSILSRLGITIDEESQLSPSSSVTSMKSSITRASCLQIGRWLSECMEKHERCRDTLSGNTIDESFEPPLPKRVLFVGDSASTESVVLIESNGLRGHYCALSHCWGPVEKQPLRTTKDTINAHLEGIRFDILPKTFQDAVIVTRSVGIQYLWIDSLCILQDDKDDWAEESVKMGTIYERSRLTIAAANAKNSTEGCFVWEQHEDSTESIPYCNSTEQPSGLSIHLSSQSSAPVSESPLAKRGWVLQEWRISRRIVFFTHEGVTWKCKDHELGLDHWNERVNIQENLGWSSILTQYSGRKLTYISDCLVALDGLANEMQKARQDEYHLGIWTGNLPEQLMWMMRRRWDIRLRKNQDLIGLPSWTWASRGGAKIFWSTRGIAWSREVANKNIHVEDKEIHIRGHIRSCTVEAGRGSSRDYVQSVEWKDMDEYSCYLSDLETREIIGVASSDMTGTPLVSCYCLFLMASPSRWFDWKEHNVLAIDPDETPRQEISELYTNFGNLFEPKHSEPSMGVGYWRPFHRTENYRRDVFIDEESEESETEAPDNDTPDKEKRRMDRHVRILNSRIDNERHEYMHDMPRSLDQEQREGFALDYDNGPYVSWVLLLEPVLDVKDSFRRIGMGIVLSNAWAEGPRDEKLVRIL